jgi:hypothetical protein
MTFLFLLAVVLMLVAAYPGDPWRWRALCFGLAAFAAACAVHAANGFANLFK